MTDSTRTASPTKRKAPGEVATPWGLFFLVYRMEYPHNSIFSICHSRKSQALHRKFTSLLLSFCKFLIHVLVTVHQLQRRGQHIVICCGLHGIRLVEITLHSSLSFFMPNSLRSKPLRHLGLLRTTTCIEPTTFRRLIRHYRRPAPGMFRFSSGSARPAPSPPPPARPFGWRW